MWNRIPTIQNWWFCNTSVVTYLANSQMLTPYRSCAQFSRAVDITQLVCCHLASHKLPLIRLVKSKVKPWLNEPCFDCAFKTGRNGRPLRQGTRYNGGTRTISTTIQRQTLEAKHGKAMNEEYISVLNARKCVVWFTLLISFHIFILSNKSTDF